MLSFAKADCDENNLFEFRERDGLPNVSRKILQEDSVYIAYLGGSITAQNGWRVQSMNYLKKRFPKTPFIEINASLGGTGSQLGVLRMDEDVLKYNTDLVFIEFAVNDYGISEETVYQTMEGIVRKLWRSNPFCDICFIYTTTEALINKFGIDTLHKTVIAMEKVADFYKIPSVYLPYEVVSLLKQGKLVMSPPKGKMLRVSGNELNRNSSLPTEDDGKIYFSPDGVHPFLNTGHVLYTNILKKALNKMLHEEYKNDKHNIKFCLSNKNYENARKIAISKMQPAVAWMKLPETSLLYKNYKERFDELWDGSVGATLDFTFKGRGIVAYDVLSPEGCRLEITVDGKKFFVNRFDGYCTYARFHYVELISDLDSNMEHHVHIKVINEGLDKENILLEENRKDFYANPKKYEKVHWLLNSIFVIP